LKKRRCSITSSSSRPTFSTLVCTLLVVICQPGVCCCWTVQFNSFMKCHNSLLLHLATPPKTRDYIVPCCMLLLQHCYLVSFLLLHEHDQPWGWCPFVTCPFISWNWKRHNCEQKA
jgi:hypothetical protein